MTSSLNGLRILNTRPKEQGQILSDLINAAGGIAVNYPTLEIKASETLWCNELPDLNKVNQAIFISANAVEYCFKQLKAQRISWPSSIQVIAIGHGTSKILEQHEVKVHHIPSSADSEHLLGLPNLQELNNQTVLLFKGQGGRTLIEEALLQKNANLIILPVYKRILPIIDHQFTYSLWCNDAVDIILLTSEQSIHNLFKLFSKETHSWLKNKTCLVISERLAQIAAAVGIKKIRLSQPNRIINTLLDYKD